MIAVSGNGNAGELLSQLVEPFNAYGFAFASSAARADIVDDSGKAANGVSVNGMVDRTVTDADLFHVADDRLERLRVFAGVSVKLDITDVSRICKRVIRRFNIEFFK